MTTPDNIKEEIEKEANKIAENYFVFEENPLLWGYLQQQTVELITKFYEMGKRDLVAALEELSLEQLKALKQRGEQK